MVWVPAGGFLARGYQVIRPVKTLLEVGPGKHPFPMPNTEVHYLVEPDPEARDTIERYMGLDRRYYALTCPWREALSGWPDGAVDSVIALDVIEHLDKDEGYYFLGTVRRLARVQVVLFTPLGYMPQDTGNPWQLHRSGWLPEEFGAEWQIIACQDFRSDLVPPMGAFWAIWNREGE